MKLNEIMSDIFKYKIDFLFRLVSVFALFVLLLFGERKRERVREREKEL
jgi:hypothetical protein